MQQAEARTVFHAFVDALNTGDLEPLHEAFAPDAKILESPRGDLVALQALPGMIEALRASVPDVQVRIQHAVQTESTAFVRLRVEGTHRGDFLGVPASGKRFSFTEYLDAALQDGKIKTMWMLIDIAGFKAQVS